MSLKTPALNLEKVILKMLAKKLEKANAFYSIKYGDLIVHLRPSIIF